MQPNLPPEICVQIFELLKGYRAELQALCVTTRLFCLLAQPLLFVWLEFRPSKRSISRIAAIQSMLDQRPERRGWIQILRISGCLCASTPGGNRDAEYEDAAANLLARMTSLRHLYLYEIKRTIQMFELLLPLAGLIEVSRLDAMDHETNGLQEKHDVRSTPLTLSADSRNIFPAIAKIKGPLLGLPFLQHLVLIETALSNIPIERFIQQGTRLDGLRKFEITQPSRGEVPWLLEFLRLCPNLLEIKFRASNRLTPARYTKPYSCDRTLIPNLARLSGHINLAKTFAKGRPIYAIHLSMAWIRHTDNIVELIEFARMLAGEGSTMRELHLLDSEWDDDQLERLATIFPLLRHLSLNLADSEHWKVDWFVDRFPAFVRSLKNLEVLTFRNPPIHPKSMKEILMSLQRDCRLRKLELDGDIDNSEIWVLADGVWNRSSSTTIPL